MSNYINTARMSSVTIGGADVTSRVIQWTASDEALFNNGLMITTGELILGRGGSIAGVSDYLRERYARGTEVIVDLTLSTGEEVRHPRGLLYVVSTAYDMESSELKIELGCRLALASLSDKADSIIDLAPTPLDSVQDDIQSVSGSFAAAGKYLYQDNQGVFRTGDFFEDLGHGGLPSTQWVTAVGTTVLSSSSLESGGAIPNVIDLSYKYPAGAIAGDNSSKTEVTETESQFFAQYPGSVYVRVGDGISGSVTTERPNSGYSNPCSNSTNTPGTQVTQPASCGDNYSTEQSVLTFPATTLERSEKYYRGVGGQISSERSEVYGPAVQLNTSYYADLYAACRYTYGTTCNPGGDCPLDGIDNVLQSYVETNYTYDDYGQVTQKVTNRYDNLLSAAQDFDWRAGVVDGIPQNFTPLPTTNHYLAEVTINDYFQEDSANVEEVTSFRSIALEGSGIGGKSTDEDVSGISVSLGEVITIPNISGAFSDLSTSTDGNGTGLEVDATFAPYGKVLELELVNFIPPHFSNVITEMTFEGQNFEGVPQNFWPAATDVTLGDGGNTVTRKPAGSSITFLVTGREEWPIINYSVEADGVNFTYTHVDREQPYGHVGDTTIYPNLNSGINIWEPGDELIHRENNVTIPSLNTTLPRYTHFRIDKVSNYYIDRGNGYETINQIDGQWCILSGGSGTGLVKAKVTFRVRNPLNASSYEVNIVQLSADNTNKYKVGDILTGTVRGTAYTDHVDGELTFRVKRVVEHNANSVNVNIARAGFDYEAGDLVWVTTDSLVQAGADPNEIEGQPNLSFTIADTSGVGTGDSDVKGVQTLERVSGPVLLPGTYRNMQAPITDGNGTGLTVDIIIPNDSGTVTSAIIKQYPNFSDEVYQLSGGDLNAEEFVVTDELEGINIGSYDSSLLRPERVNRENYGYGEFEQSSSNGAGLGFTAEFGFNGLTTGCGRPYCIESSGMFLHEITNGGSGYVPGEIISFKGADLNYGWRRQSYVSRSGPDLELEVVSAVTYKGNIGVRIGGAGYAVGDTVTIPVSSLKGVNAVRQDATSDLVLRVSAVNSGNAAGPITDTSINALLGRKTFKRTKSVTITSLPLLPESVNSPTTNTEEAVTRVDIRNPKFIAPPDESDLYRTEAQIPVTLLYTDPAEVAQAVQKYSDYLRGFILGEALGISIADSLTDCLVKNWYPGAPFRYYDPFSDDLIAMRADACVWGLTPEESAVSMNGIFLGFTNGVVTINDGTVGGTTPTPISGGGATEESSTAPVYQGNCNIDVSFETTLNSGDFSMIIDIAIYTSTSMTIGDVTAEPPKPTPVEMDAITVFYVDGVLVGPGGTLETVGNGGIPYSYNGSLLSANAIIIDGDLFAE